MTPNNNDLTYRFFCCVIHHDPYRSKFTYRSAIALKAALELVLSLAVNFSQWYPSVTLNKMAQGGPNILIQYCATSSYKSKKYETTNYFYFDGFGSGRINNLFQDAHGQTVR